jgi:RNA polymerase sigma factor (sigma-70 family)
MALSTEELVQKAQEGNRAALEAVILKIQDRVYKLALRMLGHPADAEDAAQEILVKVITRLGGFKFDSAFTTWVYRVAANHLLTCRKRRAELQSQTFELYASQIQQGFSGEQVEAGNKAEQGLIVEEIRLSCLQGVLVCLDRPHRMAYILGEIFDMSSREGGFVLEILPATFRKRLSRARKRIRDFMSKNCGLVNPGNPCLCHRLVPYAVKTEWVDPHNLHFAEHPRRAPMGGVSREQLLGLDELQRIAALFRSHPDYAAPETFVKGIKEWIDAGRVEPLGKG